MRAMLRYPSIRAYLVGVIVIPNIVVVVLMWGILSIHLFSLKVRLVDQLRKLFKLLAEVNFVIVVSLGRVLLILKEVYLHYVLDMVVTLFCLDL